MNRRVFLCTAASIGAAFALSGCGYKSETYRYRLTIEVETPDGLKTGSSVIEVKFTETGDDAFVTPEAAGQSATLRGEAAMVDLPDGRVLFALLRSTQQSDAGKWYAARAIRTPSFSGDYAGIRRTQYMKQNGLSGDLLGDQRPMLVTFGDLSDPTSVAQVDPDDLAASFGEGVTLKRITVQMTDDPVTSGIEQRLGWLPNIKGALVQIPISDYPPAGTALPLYGQLTEVDFQRRTAL